MQLYTVYYFLQTALHALHVSGVVEESEHRSDSSTTAEGSNTVQPVPDAVIKFTCAPDDG